METIKVPGTRVIGMQPFWDGLGGFLDELGVAPPKQFLQPDGVEGTGREHGPIWFRDFGNQFGNGEDILTGEERLQRIQRTGTVIGKLLVIQTFGQEEETVSEHLWHG